MDTDPLHIYNLLRKYDAGEPLTAAETLAIILHFAEATGADPSALFHELADQIHERRRAERRAAAADLLAEFEQIASAAWEGGAA